MHCCPNRTHIYFNFSFIKFVCILAKIKGNDIMTGILWGVVLHVGINVVLPQIKTVNLSNLFNVSAQPEAPAPETPPVEEPPAEGEEPMEEEPMEGGEGEEEYEEPMEGEGGEEEYEEPMEGGEEEEDAEAGAAWGGRFGSRGGFGRGGGRGRNGGFGGMRRGMVSVAVTRIGGL
jgi:hypothetical protein